MAQPFKQPRLALRLRQPAHLLRNACVQCQPGGPVQQPHCRLLDAVVAEAVQSHLHVADIAACAQAVHGVPQHVGCQCLQGTGFAGPKHIAQHRCRGQQLALLLRQLLNLVEQHVHHVLRQCTGAYGSGVPGPLALHPVKAQPILLHRIFQKALHKERVAAGLAQHQMRQRLQKLVRPLQHIVQPGGDAELIQRLEPQLQRRTPGLLQAVQQELQMVLFVELVITVEQQQQHVLQRRIAQYVFQHLQRGMVGPLQVIQT